MSKGRKITLAVFLVVIVALMIIAVTTGSPVGTAWSLLPPLVAIILALITKEVYSSLFAGILSGVILIAKFKPIGISEGEVGVVDGINKGLVECIKDEWNIGILIFLILLGIIVALINKAGGSIAFGEWAKKHVKTRVGAQLATFLLGVLIFVDDYFNCLTVGSVMRPVSDTHKISRAKLAYLIDATAAPICMIAPVSSWAAAVSSQADKMEVNGLWLFIQAIPYNFYSILTIVMIIAISLMKFDYGPMKRHELNAINGDLFTEGEKNDAELNNETVGNGKVIDLILPVVVLIVCCVLGMVYTGGLFSGASFITAFEECDASVGLSLGGLVAVLFTVIYLIARKKVNFKDAMACIPKGFVAMVAPILILTFAWTLKGTTDALGTATFVANMMESSAENFRIFLPAIIFVVALFLSFSTGTSWGTFTILIPIVGAVFQTTDPKLLIIGISACLAGAVCGDHCSPISDTTIMASAGAQCNHVNHVSTQLPYALTVAGVSFVCFILAGLIKNWIIMLPISIALMVGTLFIIKLITKKQKAN